MVNYSSQSISLTWRFSVNMKDVKVKVVFRIHLLLSDDFQAALPLRNRRHHLGWTSDDLLLVTLKMKTLYENQFWIRQVKLLPREGVHPRRPQPESGSPPPRKPGRRTFTLIHTYHWYYQMLRLFSNLEKKGDLTILLPWPQVRSRKWPLPRPPWSQRRSRHKFL